MFLFDTHAHYNLSPLYENWQEHWIKAQENGVTKSIVVGAGMESSKRAVEIASQAKGLYASIGKHPDVYRQAVKIKLQNHEDWQSVFTDIQEDIKSFRKIILEEIIVAIGEVGLDYYRMPEKGDKRKWMIEAQKKAFEAQINLALEFDLPIIVHIRDRKDKADAHWEALEILGEFKNKEKNLKFVLHCVSGPLDYLQKGLELGAYIGVDGNVTYEGVDKLIDLIKIVPENKLLLETDAPYLAPEPYRGEICQPWMLRLVAEFLEKELNISKRQFYTNANAFFKLS
ncbi:MAG: TatD family hydrolase [Patescibacteria group bacterium]